MNANALEDKDFNPHKLSKGSVLHCTGHKRGPNTLRLRIEDAGNSCVIVATNLDNNQQVYMGVARGMGGRYFLMYLGYDFNEVKVVTET